MASCFFFSLTLIVIKNYCVNFSLSPCENTTKYFRRTGGNVAIGSCSDTFIAPCAPLCQRWLVVKVSMVSLFFFKVQTAGYCLIFSYLIFFDLAFKNSARGGYLISNVRSVSRWITSQITLGLVESASHHNAHNHSVCVVLKLPKCFISPTFWKIVRCQML